METFIYESFEDYMEELDKSGEYYSSPEEILISKEEALQNERDDPFSLDFCNF